GIVSDYSLKEFGLIAIQIRRRRACQFTAINGLVFFFAGTSLSTATLGNDQNCSGKYQAAGSGKNFHSKANVESFVKNTTSLGESWRIFSEFSGYSEKELPVSFCIQGVGTPKNNIVKCHEVNAQPCASQQSITQMS